MFFEVSFYLFIYIYVYFFSQASVYLNAHVLGSVPPTMLLFFCQNISFLLQPFLSAKSNWQLQSLSSAQLLLSVCLQKAYKKRHSQIPPSLFIFDCDGPTERTLSWIFIYRRGLSHFAELTLHSHRLRSCINIKWLITVLHSYGASFVINGWVVGGVVGVYRKRKAPALICCQDPGINRGEQTTTSWDVALVTSSLILSRTEHAHTALKSHSHTHTEAHTLTSLLHFII